MSAQTWTQLLVALTFSLYVAIAFRTRASSTGEFYVAGGGVPPYLNGMATGADWMSAASFISMAGLISLMGRDGSVYLMGWTGGYVLLALLLAPYLRKFGKFTVPDFIGDRYYSQTARMVAVVCALFVSFTYVAGQMRGVGIVFSRFLGVGITEGVIIGMAIVFVYSVLGGMKGITYTQVAQYCVMMFAYLVPAIFISLLVTGHFVPQIGFGAEVITEGGARGVSVLDRLDGLSEELGFSAYTQGQKSKVDVFFIAAALMVGTAGLPHVIVRFFTVPTVKAARASAAWALFFIAIVYTTAPAVAAFARLNLLETLKERPYSDLPRWFENWARADLIQYEDKNADGIVQYVGPSSPLQNEVTIDPDIMVLANPEIAELPNWVIGLVAAGGLAAALSTAAGLLLVISTSVSHDFLKKGLRPTISEKGELLAARIAASVAVCVAGYFGINPPGFVAQVVAFAFGLAAASFFPALVLGIFSKRVNRPGAVSGMIVGLVFTMAYIVYFKFINVAANVPSRWLLGISPEGIGTLGMLLNFTVALTVSALTSAPPKEIQEMVEKIRLPGDPLRHPSGHVVKSR